MLFSYLKCIYLLLLLYFSVGSAWFLLEFLFCNINKPHKMCVFLPHLEFDLKMQLQHTFPIMYS